MSWDTVKRGVRTGKGDPAALGVLQRKETEADRKFRPAKMFCPACEDMVPYPYRQRPCCPQCGGRLLGPPCFYI